MSTTLHTIGTLRLKSAITGKDAGTVEVSKRDDGTVELHLDRNGEESVLRMKRSCALSLARLLEMAASDVPLQ